MPETSTCLVTGGAGNLACHLSRCLSTEFQRIVLFDVAAAPVSPVASNAVFERGDLVDSARLEELFVKYKPAKVVHLASLLSGSCEQNRPLAWRVNMDGTFALFEVALRHGRPTVLFASSVASYGAPSPELVTHDTPQWPDGLYGVTKMAVERLGVYYHRMHGLDFRCLRLPITVSRQAPPGAASALAARAFIEAVQAGTFTFRARADTRLALIYAPDVMRALAGLLRVPESRLQRRVYNISAMTATPGDLSQAIRRRLTDVTFHYEVDEQVDRLLAGWPGKIDDQPAREDWDWKPAYDLDAMAADFIEALQTEAAVEKPVVVPVSSPS